MSYQVLARKWRPKTFQEVVGQEHILQTLINALTQNRLHHAYLFTGTRGIGKTSLGRTLAKCFNCETAISATPCGMCDACQSIDRGKFIDLIEIDAASRTKVEDIRELLQNVQYAPTQGRFKIYLIDEVHMLSGHSFNALLKTLEEPPEHVKFLLATTDKQRLPITILSRCLQFNLKNIAPEKIVAHLKNILTAEQISFEEPALKRIALAALGSIRDALSLLDQAIAYGGGQVLTTEVNTMLGVIEQDKIFNLALALAKNESQKIFTIINELAVLGADFGTTLDDLIELLHKVSLLQVIPTCDTTNWEYATLIHELATDLQPEKVQLYYQIALIGKRDLALAPNLQQGFEMTILRMLAFQPEQPKNLPPAPSPPPRNTTQTNPTQSKFKVTPLTQPQPATTPVNLKTPLPPASVTKGSSQDINLTQMLPHLKLTGTTQALIHHCEISSLQHDWLELLLAQNQAPLLNGKHEERLSQAFSEYFARPIIVTLKLKAGNLETPAIINARNLAAQKAAAKQDLAQDTNLQNILQTFDARILEDTIEQI